jgi:hypothetical protein
MAQSVGSEFKHSSSDTAKKKKKARNRNKDFMPRNA